MFSREIRSIFETATYDRTSNVTNFMNDLTVNNNLLYVDSSHDKIGIGLVPSTSGDILQINGNVNISGTITSTNQTTIEDVAVEDRNIIINSNNTSGVDCGYLIKIGGVLQGLFYKNSDGKYYLADGDGSENANTSSLKNLSVGNLESTGLTMNGNISTQANKITTTATTFNDNEMVTKQWVEANTVNGDFLPRDGSSAMTGNLDLGNYNITNLNDISINGTITSGGDALLPITATNLKIDNATQYRYIQLGADGDMIQLSYDSTNNKYYLHDGTNFRGILLDKDNAKMIMQETNGLDMNSKQIDNCSELTTEKITISKTVGNAQPMLELSTDYLTGFFISPNDSWLTDTELLSITVQTKNKTSGLAENIINSYYYRDETSGGTDLKTANHQDVQDIRYPSATKYTIGSSTSSSSHLLKVNGSSEFLGNLDMNSSYKIINLSNATDSGDAVNKSQLDGKLSLTGGTMSGNLAMGTSYKITDCADPTNNQDVSTRIFTLNEVYNSQRILNFTIDYALNSEINIIMPFSGNMEDIIIRSDGTSWATDVNVYFDILHKNEVDGTTLNTLSDNNMYIGDVGGTDKRKTTYMNDGYGTPSSKTIGVGDWINIKVVVNNGSFSNLIFGCVILNTNNLI